MAYDSDLFNYLANYITESRLARFQEVIKHRTKYLTFVIEDVFQPHNASAVVRSCDCFGIHDLHVIESRNDYKTDKNIALGAGKWVNIHKYKDLENTTTNCLAHLKKQGYKIVATTPHKDDYTLSSIPINEPLAVVFGTEMAGITDEVKENADYFLKIPMFGFTESLNISVAAAITAQNLYERVRASSAEWQLTDLEKQKVLLSWIKKSVKNSDLILDQFLKTRSGESLT